MKHNVVMPSLGKDAGDECTVSFWHIDEGESIEKDAPLVEMATDKAVFDVPCPVAGTLLKILAKEDQVVKVGSTIAEIETSA